MATCPCDSRIFPPILEIPAGLDRLPRQIGGFSEFRLELLAGIARTPALDGWRAREGDDFGLMILEWWAYVLDVLAFYSGEIGGELYLRTAQRDSSVRRLTALIGYTPAPPLAASATLALFAEPGQPIVVPAGTAFRSDAFDGQPPQVFESDEEARIDASLNEWTIAPIRPMRFEGGPLLLDVRSASISENQLVLLEWGNSRHAAKVVKIAKQRLLDGETYVRPTLDPPPTIPASQQIAAIRLSRPTQRASLNAFSSNKVSRDSSVRLVLDALYPQIRVGTTVVIEGPAAGQLHAARVDAVSLSWVSLAAGEDDGLIGSVVGTGLFGPEDRVPVRRAAANSGTGPTAPFTQVTLAGAGPSWIETSPPAALSLHFNPILAGTLVRPGKSEISLDDLRASAALAGPIQPLRLGTRSRVLLRDALELGADLAANVADDGAGNGTLTPLGTARLPAPLRTPVATFGNLVAVSRGESAAEVLGSGDAARSFQTFRLKKKPLTYLASPGSRTGRQSTLQIWVDAVRWREVPSLFGVGPEDRVYTVRQTVDGETEISFGGGGFGQPLPSGVDNVRAVYRFGGGAASPPAGALRQFARPVKGIRRVVNPLAAFGGDDGDRPEDIRAAAPNSALSLGRAISLLDFEAIARGYRGILNAAATWSWDTREQRAAVTLWIVPPNDDEAEQLRSDLAAHLVANSAPGTPITVGLAVAVPATLAVDFTAAPDRDRSAVQAEVLAVLTDADTGLLSRRLVPIGAPLFRADILAAVRAVDGVEDLRGLALDSASAPFALTVEEGRYLDITLVAGR
jgi:hypothetical protein